MIILGKVRPLSRRLAKAHPQVLIIAQAAEQVALRVAELDDDWADRAVREWVGPTALAAA